MDNNNKPLGDNQPKMPRFNMNWIYTIILVVLLVGFFSDGGSAIMGGPSASQEATYTKFKIYVQKGYAKSVVINKDKGTLRMYVKPDKIRDVFGQSGQQVGRDPFVSVTYGSADALDTYLTAAQQTGSRLQL